MKAIQLPSYVLAFWLLSHLNAFGQQKYSNWILNHLSDLEDQYGQKFNIEEYGDPLTLFVMENDDMTFRGIFMKFKGQNFKEDVLFVSGYQNLLKGRAPLALRNHLQEGLPSEQALGNNAFPIYLDMESELMKSLNLNQYSIIRLDQKGGRIESEDFGTDRAQYLLEMKKHLK